MMHNTALYPKEMRLAPEYDLLTILPVMIFTSRANGAWNYINPALCAYTGRPAESLMDLGWTELVYPGDREIIFKQWQSAISSGNPFLIEYRLCGADSAYHWCRMQVVPQYSPSGTDTHWAGIITPVETTQLLEAERNLRHTAEQARDISDNILAISTHELRAPLTVLLGQARLLQRRLNAREDGDPNDRRTVDILVDQTLRLSALTHALLDVAQIDRGELRVSMAALELSALVRRVVQALQPTLTKHSLHLSGDSEPLVVLGDALRLEQVLQNLLQNAVKYSPAGGEITVTLAAQGQQAQIRVRDQGIGIAAEIKQRVFQRFFRATSTNGHGVPGLGIGLYLCKSIMDLHSGRIEVESSEGAGSTFTLFLPQIQSL